MSEKLITVGAAMSKLDEMAPSLAGLLMFGSGFLLGKAEHYPFFGLVGIFTSIAGLHYLLESQVESVKEVESSG